MGWSNAIRHSKREGFYRSSELNVNTLTKSVDASMYPRRYGGGEKIIHRRYHDDNDISDYELDLPRRILTPVKRRFHYRHNYKKRSKNYDQDISNNMSTLRKHKIKYKTNTPSENDDGDDNNITLQSLDTKQKIKNEILKNRPTGTKVMKLRCYNKKSINENGLYFTCGTCVASIKLTSRFYPRYFTESHCIPTKSYCLHDEGNCVQNKVFLPIRYNDKNKPFSQLSHWDEFVLTLNTGCSCRIIQNAQVLKHWL